MITYNKLVRDKIPGIIRAQGKQCQVSILEDDQYLASLNLKLGEELREYLQHGEVEELADLVEVVYAILEHQGMSVQEFEEVRLTKLGERGGFAKRFYLETVSEIGRAHV